MCTNFSLIVHANSCTNECTNSCTQKSILNAHEFIAYVHTYMYVYMHNEIHLAFHFIIYSRSQTLFAVAVDYEQPSLICNRPIKMIWGYVLFGKCPFRKKVKIEVINSWILECCNIQLKVILSPINQGCRGKWQHQNVSMTAPKLLYLQFFRMWYILWNAAITIFFRVSVIIRDHQPPNPRNFGKISTGTPKSWKN